MVQVLGTSTGGIGTHVASVTRGLLERGDRVVVIGPQATEDQFGFKRAGARFIPVEIPTGNDAVAQGKAVVRLRRLLRGPGGSTPDIVHAHGLRAGLAARLARPMGSRLVTSWHIHLDTSGGGVKNRLLRETENAVARGSDVCLCTDPDQVQVVVAGGGRDVRYAPAAAPALPASTKDADTVKAELGATGRPVLLSVGRLHPVKRLDVLIDAAAAWTDLDPMPLVVIAGSGPLEAELSDHIRRTGAPVKLLGHRSDMPELLTAADLAVVTSESETRQMFSQETLRAGVPLIATRAGGIPALVGDAAKLIPPGDPSVLDKTVRELLDSSQARAELAEAGPKQAATWPTESDTIDQLDALYRELTGR